MSIPGMFCVVVFFSTVTCTTNCTLALKATACPPPLPSLPGQAAVDAASITIKVAAQPREVPTLAGNYFRVMAGTVRSYMAEKGMSCAAARKKVSAGMLRRGGVCKDAVKMVAYRAAASLLAEVDDAWVTDYGLLAVEGGCIGGRLLWHKHVKARVYHFIIVNKIMEQHQQIRTSQNWLRDPEKIFLYEYSP